MIIVGVVTHLGLVEERIREACAEVRVLVNHISRELLLLDRLDQLIDDDLASLVLLFLLVVELGYKARAATHLGSLACLILETAKDLLGLHGG